MAVIAKSLLRIDATQVEARFGLVLAKVKNFPVVQQRLYEWYEIESQFREIGSSEILERGRYLASVLDVAPSKITDYFVSNWQRKYNILLTESPVYAKRIREKKDFEERGTL